MAQFIDFTINEDGTVEVEGNGYVGKGCEAMQKVFDVFGETIEVKTKPEYHQVVKAKVKQR